MKIDGSYVKGVAYYLGDGRMAAPRSLSTVNQNIKCIKFFIKWLKKYFNINLENIKIKVKTSDPNFDENKLRTEFGRKLRINNKFITSVSLKRNPNHITKQLLMFGQTMLMQKKSLMHQF